jgi:hypothetical protein
MVDGNIGALFESDPVELIGRIEHAVLQDIVQLKVGLDCLFVEVVPGFANLLGIEVPIPGLELETAFLGVDYGLNIFGLDASALAVDPGTSSSINLSAVSGFFAIWSSSLHAA